MIPHLTVKRMGKAFWVVGDEEPIGPYDNREEADEARRGRRRFYLVWERTKHLDHITTEDENRVLDQLWDEGVRV